MKKNTIIPTSIMLLMVLIVIIQVCTLQSASAKIKLQYPTKGECISAGKNNVEKNQLMNVNVLKPLINPMDL